MINEIRITDYYRFSLIVFFLICLWKVYTLYSNITDTLSGLMGLVGDDYIGCGNT
jgi:hypothetical protein